MPFESEKQRRFMWAKHPEIAKKWAHGEHSSEDKDDKKAKKKKPSMEALKRSK